jgi:hypothetical protein
MQFGAVFCSSVPSNGIGRQPDVKHLCSAMTTTGALHNEMRLGPEVIALAGADVHAVLQWHVDVQAARSCTPISTHLQPADTICAIVAPHLAQHLDQLCTGSQYVYAGITVATQSEPAARTASVVGCMKGAHAAQLSGCTRAGPVSSKAATVSMINMMSESRIPSCLVRRITAYQSCCCQWHLLPAAATRTPPLHLMAMVQGRRPGWTAAPCWALTALLRPLTSYCTERMLRWHMPQFTQPTALQAVKCCPRAAALAGINRFCSDCADRSCKHPKKYVNMRSSCDESPSLCNHVHACRTRMRSPRL